MMIQPVRAKRSTVNGEPIFYTCYRKDGSPYRVPSYHPTSGESLESAAKAMGVTLCTRRNSRKHEGAGAVICEIHDDGRSVLAIQNQT